jgi:hypothetical protein
MKKLLHFFHCTGPYVCMGLVKHCLVCGWAEGASFRWKLRHYTGMNWL